MIRPRAIHTPFPYTTLFRSLRLLFVGIVSLLLRVPFVQFVGGALLVWIAVKLVHPEDVAGGDTKHGASLWEAIWIIIVAEDRKSTRLNSSHITISYAVFCLK